MAKKKELALEEEESFPPLSPISSALASPIIPLTVMPVFFFEVPIVESRVIEFLCEVLFPMNSRLSSIVHTDKKGVLRWKKVDVKFEDHIIVLTLRDEEFEKQLQEYVSKIAREGFTENKPMWEMHIIKGSCCNGSSSSVGAVVFKLSHVIGDGYSFLSLVLNGFKRADDASLPLTFPNVSLRNSSNISEQGTMKNWWNYAMKGFNTVPLVGRTLIKGLCLKDDKSVVRSGKEGVGLEPIIVSSLTFSLEDVKLVKSKVEGSVNDVITGIIHYAIHLYMRKEGNLSNKRMTSMVMLNMRVLSGFKSMDEMMKAGIWGNRFTNLQLPITSFPDPHLTVNPLDFIFIAKKNMKKMKDSMLIHLTSPIIKMLKCIKGPKGVAEFIYSSLINTTTLITNVIGPNERMAMAGYPISDFYYIVAGIPQSLTFAIVSWMGKLKVAITMEKEFIDSQLLTLCMNEAFHNIFEAAQGKE